MITKKSIGTTLIVLFFVAPGVSTAEFPKLPSSVAGTRSSGGNDTVVQHDELVRAYVDADKEVLSAQAMMSDAVGLKDRAAKLNAANEALGSGATMANLEASETMQSEASQEIQAKLQDSSLKLDAASKKKFSEALGLLGRGVIRYSKLKAPIASFSNALSGSINATLVTGAATKLEAGRYVVARTPGHMRNLSGTLNSAVAFAKTNNIPVPADATAAL